MMMAYAYKTEAASTIAIASGLEDPVMLSIPTTRITPTKPTSIPKSLLKCQTDLSP